MSIFTNRMQREAKTIKVMVGIYCKHNHGKSVENCDECLEIQSYALDRLRYCPYQEGKTSCRNCPIHCYKPSMKEDVKKVMRFSGPRMAIRHPILTVYHFIDDRRSEPTHIPPMIELKASQAESIASESPYESCEHLEV